VNIPTFYDGVPRIEGEAKLNLQKVADGFDLERYKRDLRAGACYRQSTLDALRRNWFEPTFEIHNYKGGLEGTKIPPMASAQVTMRLVGQQDPDAVFAYFERHLHHYLAQLDLLNVKLDVKKVKGSRAVSVAIDNPYVLAAADACEVGFGRKPVYDGCGGTIGALPVFQERFPQAPIVLLAISRVDDGYHAPNEEFKFSQAEKGVKVISDYLQRIATLPKLQP
ncbi:MAG: M20/M25/M40 family metallo-hydrolase, partial [Candidatus Wildermuthbacteria bacterium]|nr:M20/M25/M40 family metallo-hydrolase [Candidatus Wildermuthbacteria bacterium]